MSPTRRILCIGSGPSTLPECVAPSREHCEVVRTEDPIEALRRLGHEEFDGVFISAGRLQQALELSCLLRNEQVLQHMPDGVAVLDAEKRILWANGRLREWSGQKEIIGASFYSVLGSPEIQGPDFCPVHTCLATGSRTSSTLRTEDNRFFQVHVAPICDAAGTPQYLIATVRDTTAEIQQQHKLAAIHQAGMELADLTPEDVFHMTVEQRIELLKSNILHYTKDLLKFEVVEIRLLDQKTGKLEPLLSVGMEPEAAQRELYARPQGNGITGFVAATGKSYLCEDTSEDPLYLPGAAGAKSSLTVPLMLHDEVIGTFNVESRQPRAFTESDLQFLEIFSRDVAVALNTLELLVAEKACAAAASVEAIHSAVALPVDEILNDSVDIMERYIGHEPEVVERLQRIVRNARDIKQVIQRVGEKLAPLPAHLEPPQPARPKLRDARILLVDEDAQVRSAAHELLGRYGCVVETAPNGSQALSMVRNLLAENGYDAIIADIRLPDMTGYDFLVKLQEMWDVEPIPLILMTGFGYDPTHSMVKARQAGVTHFLYKPFRLDQLLDTVEKVVGMPKAVRQS